MEEIYNHIDNHNVPIKKRGLDDVAYDNASSKRQSKVRGPNSDDQGGSQSNENGLNIVSISSMNMPHNFPGSHSHMQPAHIATHFQPTYIQPNHHYQTAHHIQPPHHLLHNMQHAQHFQATNMHPSHHHIQSAHHFQPTHYQNHVSSSTASGINIASLNNQYGNIPIGIGVSSTSISAGRNGVGFNVSQPESVTELAGHAGQYCQPTTHSAPQAPAKAKRKGYKCPHKRQKSKCRDCNGSGICEHNKVKTYCKLCNGPGLCEHKRQKSRCKECGGSSICEHAMIKIFCKLCKGSQICEHDKVKNRCKECRIKRTEAMSDESSANSNPTNVVKTARNRQNTTTQSIDDNNIQMI